jgi:transposase-like protein
MRRRRSLTASEWYLVKTDYITGQQSIAELAAKHGVTASAIKQHCAQEGWAGLRTEYRAGTLVLPGAPVEEPKDQGSLVKKAKDPGTESVIELRKDGEREYAIAKAEMAMLDKLQFDLRTERVTDVIAMLAAQLLTADYNRVSQGGLESMMLTQKDWANLIMIIEKAQNVKYRALGVAPPKVSFELDHINAPGLVVLAEIKQFVQEHSGGYPALPEVTGEIIDA